jgi:hypothetical protein
MNVTKYLAPTKDNILVPIYHNAPKLTICWPLKLLWLETIFYVVYCTHNLHRKSTFQMTSVVHPQDFFM